MIDLVGKRFLFLLISLIIIIPGVLAILMGGLKVGIDFTGGKRLTVIPISAEANDADKFRNVLAANGFEDAVVKRGTIGEGSNITNTITMDIPGIAELPDRERLDAESNLARGLIEGTLVAGSHISETVAINPTGAITPTGTVTATTLAPTATTVVTATASVSSTGTVTGTGVTTGTTAGSDAAPASAAAVTETIDRWRLNEKSVVDDLTVGPTVGRELIGRAFLAILLASAAILVYLTIVFRKVPNAFRYGVCAIIALVHDVLVVMGVFAILGLVFGTEIDALFITAMLTVIGFSVHDTIVVFDRVRENLTKRRFERFDDVVNYSLVQTLARSINTSITVVLTLFALYLFGGASIKTFVLALLIGIISGTYSSLFNASMLLVIWENREWRRFFGGGRSETPARPAARSTAR
jgi:preprotein translocase SecF subunit